MKPQDRHNAIWDSPHLSDAERFLLLALCRFLNSRTDCAWPSDTTLGRMVRSKRQTVGRRFKSLAERGLITQKQRRAPHGGMVWSRRIEWAALGAPEVQTPVALEDHGPPEDHGPLGGEGPGTPQGQGHGPLGDHEPDQGTDQGTDQRAQRVREVWSQVHLEVTGITPAFNGYADQDALALAQVLDAEQATAESLRPAMAAFLRHSLDGRPWAVRRDGVVCCFGWFVHRRNQAQLAVAPPPPEPTGPPAEVVPLPVRAVRGQALPEPVRLELQRVLGDRDWMVWGAALSQGRPGELLAPNQPHADQVQALAGPALDQLGLRVVYRVEPATMGGAHVAG